MMSAYYMEDTTDKLRCPTIYVCVIDLHLCNITTSAILMQQVPTKRRAGDLYEIFFLKYVTYKSTLLWLFNIFNEKNVYYINLHHLLIILIKKIYSKCYDFSIKYALNIVIEAACFLNFSLV